MLASGDSIGTLPVVAAPLLSFTPWANNAIQGKASVVLRVNQGKARQVFHEAWGTGYVTVEEVGGEVLELRFHGEVQVVIDEHALSTGEVEMVMIAETDRTWFYSVHVDNTYAGSSRVLSGSEVDLDVIHALPQGVDSAPLNVMTWASPGTFTELRFQRGAGVVYMTQR